MSKKSSFLLVFFICLVLTEIYNQTPASNLKVNSLPKNMWELGIHAGHSFLYGDVDSKSNLGVGLHLRKAIDHTFSLRLDASYLRIKGSENEELRPVDAEIYAKFLGSNFSGDTWKPVYESSVISGELSILASLNQFRTNKNYKINPYGFLGVGIANLSGKVIDGMAEVDIYEPRSSGAEFKTSPTFIGGLGVGFKLGESGKFSLSIEHKFVRVMGGAADLLDGIEYQEVQGIVSQTGSKDLINYTSLRLGITLGRKGEKSIPLWWASPLDLIADDLSEVKARPELDLTDTDEDGVIDMLDKEENTEKGCPVNSRGETLDSDGDGTPDCRDDEIYSPPGYDLDSRGVAIIPTGPDPLTEEDVRRIIEENKNKESSLNYNGIPIMEYPFKNENIEKINIPKLKRDLNLGEAIEKIISQLCSQGYSVLQYFSIVENLKTEYNSDDLIGWVITTKPELLNGK